MVNYIKLFLHTWSQRDRWRILPLPACVALTAFVTQIPRTLRWLKIRKCLFIFLNTEVSCKLSQLCLESNLWALVFLGKSSCSEPKTKQKTVAIWCNSEDQTHIPVQAKWKETWIQGSAQDRGGLTSPLQRYSWESFQAKCAGHLLMWN